MKCTQRLIAATVQCLWGFARDRWKPLRHTTQPECRTCRTHLFSWQPFITPLLFVINDKSWWVIRLDNGDEFWKCCDKNNNLLAWWKCQNDQDFDQWSSLQNARAGNSHWLSPTVLLARQWRDSPATPTEEGPRRVFKIKPTPHYTIVMLRGGLLLWMESLSLNNMLRIERCKLWRVFDYNCTLHVREMPFSWIAITVQIVSNFLQHYYCTKERWMHCVIF